MSHAGQPGARRGGESLAVEGDEAGVLVGLPAFRDVPHPHAPEHLIGDARAGRLALGRGLNRPVAVRAADARRAGLRKC